MNANNSGKPVVTICKDYVTKDPNEVQKILDRVSKIVSSAYERRLMEGKS